MKKRCNFFFVMIAFLLTSCATNNISSLTVKSKLSKGAWGSPEDSVLLFGPKLINSDLIQFLQQNPDIGYELYNSYAAKGPGLFKPDIFFIHPLPVNSQIHCFFETHTSSKIVYKNYFGVAGVDIECPKPGLYYYDSLYINGITRKNEEYDELYCLDILLDKFEGTEWESVILKRINELEGGSYNE